MYGSGSINADTSDIRTASAPPAGSDNTEDVDVANERELTKTKSSHYPLLVQNLTRKYCFSAGFQSCTQKVYFPFV